jgi:RNA polymerase-binding protein DksA
MSETMTSSEHGVAIKRRLRDRATAIRDDIRRTLERSNEETHIRISEQARDTEDDAFSNLIVDLNHAEIRREMEELRKIDSALRRVTAGTYGICEDCDQKIDARRLEAQPTTSRCIYCQTSHEKNYAHL